MLKQRFGFKKIMLSLFLVMAVIFFISGCQPSSEVVDVESVTVSSAGGATTITEIGGTLQFSAVVLPADANDKAVVWSVVNGTGSATISTNGLLTAVANGTVTVKATSKDNSEKHDSKVITISNQDVLASSISVSSANDRAFIDTYHGTLQLSALVLPANAVNKNVIWTVENGTGSASISSAGLLTAITNGTVTVKATSAASNGVFGTKTITLSNQDASVTSVEIQSVDDVAIIDAFQGTLQLSVEVLPVIAANKAVIWSVENNTGSASISVDGLLTAESNGLVTVHAVSVSNSSVSDTMEIMISNQEVIVTAIELTSAGNVVVINIFGGTLQFMSNVLPANAADKSVTWSVTNGSGEATISQSGLLTAVANGTVTVVVTSDANPEIDETMVITISNQDVLVNSISVSGAGSKVIIDTFEGTLQMEALVLPANAADKSVTWSV
ncbi:MAG: Ig-like domain-containing protein, partial [Acholeplasma sp.]